MSELDDYVERVVLDGYRQALNDEENVARSLPFFAAALALLAALAGAIRDSIPALEFQAYPIVVWMLIAGISGAVLVSLLWLYRAIRKQSFSYPMSERDLLKYVEQLRDHYRSEMPDDQTREATVLVEVRREFLAQITEAATNNRRINNNRTIMRANALEALLLALLFAFCLVVVMIFENKVILNERPPATPVRATAPAAAAARKPTAPNAAPKTGPSTDAVHREGSGR